MCRSLLLTLLAACTAAQDITDTAYTPDKEYVYQYDIVTTSALRTTNHQIAALKINTTVHMLVDAEKLVTIKFAEPQMCMLNQEVPVEQTVETVLENSCTPLPQPEADAFSEHLLKPFQFKWQYGMPGSMHVDSTEPYWSVNIKRGLINTLSLNLEERDVIKNLSPEMSDKMMRGEPTADQLAHNVYRTYESDLVGECETIYEVQQDEAVLTNMFVKKVRNYDNCKNRPMFRNGLLASFEDIYPEIEENSAVKKFSNADYHVQGSRQEYLIMDAQITSHFSFQPFQEQESAYTATSQHLKLREVLSEQSGVEMGADLQEVESLKMNIPVELTASTEDEPIMSPEKATFLKERAFTLLTEIADYASEDVDDMVMPKLSEAVRIMMKLPKSNLQEIIDAYITNYNDADDKE